MGISSSCSPITAIISSHQNTTSTRNTLIAVTPIPTSTTPTQRIVHSPKSNIKTNDNSFDIHQDDDDLQLAIALSLKSQSNSSVSNISMLCGINGILLFEESSLLIDGFIRQIKHTLIKQYIIPLELHKLCFKYFYIPTSISKLIESRNTAELLMDTYRVFEIEKLIFNKLCSTKYNNTNHEMCELILNNWKLNDKIETFRGYVNECARRCVLKDNSYILEIILHTVIYDEKYEQWNMIRMNQIMYLINESARYNAIKCLTILLENPSKLDWTNELVNPTVLLNAVKYNYTNLNLIHFIIDRLKLVKIKFVCNDIMEEIIKYDLVEIGKRIVCNRWHELNKNDTEYAKFMDLKCNNWIIQRMNGYTYYSDGDNVLDLNEWRE